MTAIPHGTASGYVNHRCRCDDCRAAASEYRRAWRARARLLPVKQIPHGTRNGYLNYGCRCYPCHLAKAAYDREYAARHRRAAFVSDLGELLAQPTDDVPLGQYFRAVVAARDVWAELQTRRTEVLTLRAELTSARAELVTTGGERDRAVETLKVRTAQWQKLADQLVAVRAELAGLAPARREKAS
jgi:hypothetical protein